MEKLMKDFDNVCENIRDIENQIEQAKCEAENNIAPLKEELSQIKEDKRKYAIKNDFASVQSLNSRERNLKFKIAAQWNKYSLLKEDLTKLNRQRQKLEDEIQLKKDYIKREKEILSRMNLVLKNYKKTRTLKDAAYESKISYDQVRQWYEWGERDLNDNCRYFYKSILETDEYFKSLEEEKLKKEMDEVLSAYLTTGSLEKASQISGVSYDTVQYWYKWGSMGFGEENVYFFKKINEKKDL